MDIKKWAEHADLWRVVDDVTGGVASYHAKERKIGDLKGSARRDAEQVEKADTLDIEQVRILGKDCFLLIDSKPGQKDGKGMVSLYDKKGETLIKPRSTPLWAYED